MSEYVYDGVLHFTADQRYYASAYGRFNTVDPSSHSVHPKNPGSWNRYAYVGGDPVNHNDPRGLDQSVCTDPGDPVCPVSTEPDPCWDLSLGLFDGSLTCGAPISASVAPAAGDDDDDSPPPCGAANGLTANQTIAVETVMGENSNYLIGRPPYPGAPTVTSAAVYQEDVDMFSVLTNRAIATSSTIGGVISSHPGQFTGYSAGPNGGITQFNAALSSAQGSSPCNDLTAIVAAMNYVIQNGSQLASNYLYWKSINQGNGVFHVQQPGDIYVANTAFGAINTN